MVAGFRDNGVAEGDAAQGGDGRPVGGRFHGVASGEDMETVVAQDRQRMVDGGGLGDDRLDPFREDVHTWAGLFEFSLERLSHWRIEVSQNGQIDPVHFVNYQLLCLIGNHSIAILR